jgi:hypothetical protein
MENDIKKEMNVLRFSQTDDSAWFLAVFSHQFMFIMIECNTAVDQAD